MEINTALRGVIEMWKSQCFLGKKIWEREHLHCGDSVSGFCVVFYILCLFSLQKWFVPFSYAAVWRAGCYCGCTSVCLRLCWRDRAPFFPTASHMLGHTAAPWPELHGTQENGEQTLLVLLEVLHHLSEQHMKKRNWTGRVNKVLISCQWESSRQ